MIDGIVRLKEAITAGWRSAVRRWEWPASHQVEQARIWIDQDLRWLCLDKKLEAVCERHLALLAPDWMSVPREDISAFRRRIGCDPHDNARADAPASVLPADRLPIMVRNDDDFCRALELCKSIEAENHQALSADAFYIYAVPAMSYALHRMGSMKQRLDDIDGAIHF